MHFFIQYMVTLVVFTLIDLVWLLRISKKLYQSKIGHLMAKKANIPAAVIFYLLYIFALVFFVVNPAVDRGSVLNALGAGALFGLVAYATYDLTNLATLRDWPVSVTIIDLIWGTFLSSTTCAAATWISGSLL